MEILIFLEVLKTVPEPFKSFASTMLEIYAYVGKYWGRGSGYVLLCVAMVMCYYGHGLLWLCYYGYHLKFLKCVI